MMKLLTPENDVRGQKVLAVAAFADVQLSCPSFVLGKDNKTPDFLEKSPLGRLPVLETPQGAIFDSGAIVRHIARLRPEYFLYGETLFESSKIDMWTNFCTHELEIPVFSLIQGGQVEQRAIQDTTNALNVLDKHLLDNTFMVGKNLTIADISIAAVIALALKKKFTDDKIPSNVMRWFKTITNRQAFIKVFGDPQNEKKMSNTTGSAPPEGVLDEEISNEKAKKPVDSLDLLPPSSLVLDEWKKIYSNSKFLYEEAMPWLWENFDDAGWSFWYMKYDKQEDECKIPFVTLNQLGGFLQRIDPSFRKYSFGSFYVLGDDGNYDVEGVLMVRGQEIPNMLKEHPSYEYHIFEKLDHKDSAKKKIIEDFFCSAEVVGGKKIFDGKLWK